MFKILLLIVAACSAANCTATSAAKSSNATLIKTLPVEVPTKFKSVVNATLLTKFKFPGNATLHNATLPTKFKFPDNATLPTKFKSSVKATPPKKPLLLDCRVSGLCTCATIMPFFQCMADMVAHGEQTLDNIVGECHTVQGECANVRLTCFYMAGSDLKWDCQESVLPSDDAGDDNSLSLVWQILIGVFAVLFVCAFCIALAEKCDRIC